MKNLLIAVVILVSSLFSTNLFADETVTSTEQVILYVDINNDGAEKLADLLLGVGALKAQAIVDYRETHGAFTSVEDLLSVPGIGPATLEKNRQAILIGEFES